MCKYNRRIIYFIFVYFLFIYSFILIYFLFINFIFIYSFIFISSYSLLCIYKVFSLAQKTFFDKISQFWPLATRHKQSSIPPFDGKFLSIYQNPLNELYLQIRAFTRDLSRSLFHLPWEYTRGVRVS